MDDMTLCPGTKYSGGCRCDNCRAHHREKARQRTRDRAYGITRPLTRLDPAETVAQLNYLRSEGLTWQQVSELVGVNRRDLSRLYLGKQVHTTIRRAEQVAAAVERYRTQGVGKAGRRNGDYARWMVHALEARGWDTLFIGRGMGLTHRVSLRKQGVYWWTEDRLSELFHEHHDKWGPRRLTAVGAWRRGHFPADCYEWDQDVPDLRPIPGSLHPDLVVEACTYTSTAPKKRPKQVLMSLHTLGQWENERCARTSMANWTEFRGYEPEDYSDVEHAKTRGPFCRKKEHKHGLPDFWQVDQAKFTVLGALESEDE